MTRIAPIPQLTIQTQRPAALWYAVLTALGVALAIVAWYAGQRGAAPQFGRVQAHAEALKQALSTQAHATTALKGQLALAQRSEQVARTANESLQATLRDREEEIAALRADLSFYQRLVGGSAARIGLTIHALKITPVADSRSYRFELTLTQNIKKGTLNQGQVNLAVEGVKDQKVAQLDWKQLAPESASDSLPFAFKYFQKLQGNLLLPEGFVPNRILVQARSEAGDQTQQDFTWESATGAKEG